MNSADDDIIVELDGPGVHPKTVEPRVFLEIAASFLGLLLKVADEEEIELQLHDLRIIDKCAAVAVKAADIGGALPLVRRAFRMAQGAEKPVLGGSEFASRVQVARRSLPSGYTAKVAAGNWSEELNDASATPRLAGDHTTIRARARRVGGATPRATFESDSESKPFTLELSVELARRLARYLYDEVEIEAIVWRDGETLDIENGSLVDFEPLTGEPGEAFRSWAKDNFKSWDEYERDRRDDDT